MRISDWSSDVCSSDLGVTNPPADPPKYGYWTRKGKAPKDPEKWLETATPVPGSWWPEWAGWLSRHGGGQVPARVPGDRALAVIEAATGRYVKVKSSE